MHMWFPSPRVVPTCSESLLPCASDCCGCLGIWGWGSRIVGGGVGEITGRSLLRIDPFSSLSWLRWFKPFQHFPNFTVLDKLGLVVLGLDKGLQFYWALEWRWCCCRPTEDTDEWHCKVWDLIETRHCFYRFCCRAVGQSFFSVPSSSLVAICSQCSAAQGFFFFF